MGVADEVMLRKFQKELNSGIVSLVLLAILDRSGEPLYGYQIAKSIEGNWQEGGPVKQGTLYPVLRSMEETGLLASRVEPSVSGPPRKYYTITDRGRVVLADWKSAWSQTSDFVNMTLEGGTVPDTIEAYLIELRAALAGADPALVQDAVYDAEEYLRSAVAEGGATPEAIAAAIDAYGTPAEIAAAYRETERTVAAALRRPVPAKSANPFARFFGVIADPGAWGALFYMLLSLATGILYFTVVVTGLSLSAGLMVLIIGIPMALLFIAAVRAISLAEGRIVEGLLGQRMPRRPRMAGMAATGESFWERIKSWLVDYRTWTTMLYMLLMLPLGIAYFTVVVTALSLSLAAFALPIAQWVTNSPIIRINEWGYLIEPWGAPFFFAGGILGFFVTMWLAKGVGYLHGMFAKTMLVGRFEGGAQ